MCQNCPKRTAELVILNINHPILGHPIFTHTHFKTMKSMFSSFMYLWKVAGHEIVPNSYKFFYRSVLAAKCTAGASSNCLSFLDMFPLRMSCKCPIPPIKCLYFNGQIAKTWGMGYLISMD